MDFQTGGMPGVHKALPDGMAETDVPRNAANPLPAVAVKVLGLAQPSKFTTEPLDAFRVPAVDDMEISTHSASFPSCAATIIANYQYSKYE